MMYNRQLLKFAAVYCCRLRSLPVDAPTHGGSTTAVPKGVDGCPESGIEDMTGNTAAAVYSSVYMVKSAVVYCCT